MTVHPPPVRYVCSKCGGPSVQVDPERTVMDERYPTGWCERCTPVPKARQDKKTDEWYTPARKTVALLRADLEDPGDRAHRAKVAKMRELAARLHPTTAAQKRRRHSEAELREASAAVAWLRRAE